MTRNNEAAVEDFTADLAAVRKDVARLAETMSELVQHQTQAAGLRVSGVLEDAGSKIASTAADAQDRVRAASVDIEAGIERHPLTALLIAFGIGMSLGMIGPLAPLISLARAGASCKPVVQAMGEC